MRRFDCLASETPIFGPHLLEASAGTGKTFSIEHIYVRLILEGIEVKQVLAVTFTRAATRELKGRIRENLEKALKALSEKKPIWDYLRPYAEKGELIQQALSEFNQCQIFTIHGFCYRMLKEFAFEAKIGSLGNPDEGKKIPDFLRKACVDFLENGIDEDLLCEEQMALLLKEFESMEKLIERLLALEELPAAPCFLEAFNRCKAALHTVSVKEEKLLEDFLALEPNFKSGIKGDFISQVKALANFQEKKAFRILLKERGSLFDFLNLKRKKVRAKEPASLHYPGFFDWAREHIGPLVKQRVFPILQSAWKAIAQKILQEEEHLDPDEILKRMRRALENADFAQHVEKKYAAAIIDEFQDTDAVQWEIFQKLFFEKPMRAVYLVGDPKQSIYRFRKADVYTYLKAQEFLGEEHTYQLDTNFRSSKGLIGALNALFHREWLFLPKEKRALPYCPVRAGAQIKTDFDDEKGSIHFLISEGEPASLFERVFLPFTAREIQKFKIGSCAILVKDRYQIQKAVAFLNSQGIPAVAKSYTPLGQTEAFQAISELFDAITFPKDKNLARIVMAGPFRDESIIDLRSILEEKGLAFLAQKIPLDSDGEQIFELLFAWEKAEGFSFEGLKRCLNQLRSEERRVQVDEEAVQIMTLHISKGLEFDVVFAIGLSARTKESGDSEEMEAEKKRLLYVAMTRAKKRLYVPIAISDKDPDPGTHSPMELFLSHFKNGHEEIFELAKRESITFEHLRESIQLEPFQPIQIKEPKKNIPRERPYKPFFLNSFTSLAKPHEIEWKPEEKSDEFTLQTMPRGSETGILIHSIFEELFGSKEPIWQESEKIERLIRGKIKFSPLELWENAIVQMVLQTLSLPLLEGFCLSSLKPKDLQVEMEFVYADKPNLIKGFIDLVFRYKEKIYLVDWKTNWLENYEKKSLKNEMQTHDYYFQASIYQEALYRHIKMKPSAFYIFVRGGAWIEHS